LYSTPVEKGTLPLAGAPSRVEGCTETETEVTNPVQPLATHDTWLQRASSSYALSPVCPHFLLLSAFRDGHSHSVMEFTSGRLSPTLRDRGDPPAKAIRASDDTD
jgi:hypothetical protein